VLTRFNDPWDSVPLCVIDTETTGKRPGIDRTVQVGAARFEQGKLVAVDQWLVNPGIPIPAEATSVHGITDEMVSGAHTLTELFTGTSIQHLIAEAQPAAYNAAFDRHFVPPFGHDWSWPWLDVLMLVRKQDRFAKGAGRHKLAASCERHGITLTAAHSAGADAQACGELLYKLGRETFPKRYTLGQALGFCRRAEVEEWFRYNEWLSRQPAREEKAAS
jgi:DNA polymerase-3 subunit epsilon